MGAPRERWFRLAAVALLGAFLAGAGYFLQVRDSRLRSAPAPEPAWRSADRSAAFLEQQIRPLAAGDSTRSRHALARLQACTILPATNDSLRLRLIRSLNSGHEFDSEILLTRQAVKNGYDLELNRMREAKEPAGLRIAVRAGAVEAVSQGAGTPPIWGAWTGATQLPLALGDLQMGEVLELCRAVAGGEVQALGYLDGMGAQPQLLLEANLAPPRGGSSSENPAAGARAIAYVDSATCALRSVRVLDEKGFVVRVYDGLIWQTLDSGARLSQVRVTSMPSNSHTLLHRIAARGMTP